MNPSRTTPPPHTFKNTPLLQILSQRTQNASPKPKPAQAPPQVQAPEPARSPALSQGEPEPYPAQYASLDRMDLSTSGPSSCGTQAPQTAPATASEWPQATGWESTPNPRWHAQHAAPSVYDAVPPPAQFIHALPIYMAPNTYGPTYTTPNGMLQYYAFANQCGRTNVTFTAPAPSMQALYEELGCTMPRYREP